MTYLLTKATMNILNIKQIALMTQPSCSSQKLARSSP